MSDAPLTSNLVVFLEEPDQHGLMRQRRVGPLAQVVSQYTDEIERLTEELDIHLKVHLGVVRENVRLREALKKLVDWTTEKTPGWAPLEQARAALAGDETTGKPK
jgi:hypothetical protein